MKVVVQRTITTANRFQRGSGPCRFMPDCNFSHYTLQQNLYKWLLETNYSQWTWRGHSYTSVRVASMKLAVFHEAHGATGLYLDVPDIGSVVAEVLAERRAAVKVHVNGPVTPDPSTHAELVLNSPESSPETK